MSALEVAGRARAHAGPDALARVIRERSLLLRFAAGRATQATAIDDSTVELAVLRSGHVGRAMTNRTDEDGLAECARLARSGAEVAAVVGPGAHPGFAAAEPSAPLDAVDRPTAQLDPEVGGAALTDAFEAAAGHGVEVHGIWSAGARDEAVAGADISLESQGTDAYMKVIAVDPRSGRSGFAATAARGVAEMDARALVDEAAMSATRNGDAVELPSGQYPVVFAPQAVGLICDLFGQVALNGLAHAEGRGALVGQLGRRIAAPAVNLADSPGYRLTLPRGFDAEGTPKRPRPLIQDGVAIGVAHDRRSGALAGAESTGHAIVPGGHPDGPYPTNLVLAGGGAADVADLCAPIERGLYVTRLWYANVVRPKQGLITAVTRDGTFLIEDGALTRPVRDLRMADSVLGILARVQALTGRQQLVSEAHFYGRRVPYGVVCPAVRVSSVRFVAPA